ncbi:MAG: hypothetical protein LBH81_01005 [Rickettsiales bacterium]|jgi:hypothetical protein|nr:hypothetical protein [Rickettsiales bacterium]
MKVLNSRFWLVSACALALALPAASEPIMFYAEEEEIYDEIPGQAGYDNGAAGMTNENEARPSVVVPGGAGAQRAGAVIPSVKQNQGARGSQVVSRQPNFAPTGPQGRNVQNRNIQGRSAVPMAVQQRGTVQQRSAAPARGTVQAPRATAPRAVGTRGSSQQGRGAVQSGTQLVAGTSPTAAAISNEPAAQANQPVAARAALTGSPITSSRTSVARNANASAAQQLIDEHTAQRQELESLKTALDIANERSEIQMQIDDSCLAQFYGCMDDICANVNDTLGRCACSPNAENYKEMDDRLKKVNIELQDVVRNIQYLGLTTDEVNSLFMETEAERALNQMSPDIGGGQSTMLRDLLMGVELPDIADIGTQKTKSPFQSSFIDMADFGDFGDLFGNTTKKTFNDIANMSGKDLYNAAKQKCEFVLKECQKKKVDVEMIQAKYDVEIGKQCVYIRDDLDERIETATNMLRQARTMLERARFQVAQNKNLFDLKECVQEMDKCMTDDFVCGKNYVRCIDGTGQFVSSDGKDVVPGADLIYMQHTLWGGTSGSADYAVLAGLATKKVNGKEETIWPFNPSRLTDGGFAVNPSAEKVVQILASKIGYIGKDGYAGAGFCAAVMNQCQRYTRSGNEATTFDPNNEVVKNYLLQALPKIRSAQDKFITEFQVQCVSDLKSCYQRQIQSMSGGYYGSVSNINLANFSTMRAACSSIGFSCALAVNSSEFNSSSGSGACRRTPTDAITTTTDIEKCLNSVSTIALSGLITCPTGASIELDSSKNPVTNNNICKCQTGNIDLTTNSCR